MEWCAGKHEIVVPSKVSETQRFSMIICGMFCSIGVAAVYAFALISDKLTKDYHYNQNDITTISTVGIVVGYFALPFSYIYDYFGPRPAFILGILIYGTGLLFFALTFVGKIGHSVASIAVLNAVAYVGSTLFDLAAILSILSWFPLDRGPVVACVKSMTGLGGSVVATIYNAFFQGMHTEYMYFLIAFVTVIGVLSLFFIELPPFHMTGYRLKNYTENDFYLSQKSFEVYLQRRAPLRRFFIIFFFIGALMVVILTQSVVFVFIEKPTLAQRVPPAVLMILIYLLLPFTLLPCKFLRGESTRGSEVSPSAEVNNDEEVLRPVLRKEEAEEKKEGGGALEGAQEPLNSSHQDRTAEEVPSSSDNKLWGKLGDDAHDFFAGYKKLSPQYLTGFHVNVRRPVFWCMWINGFCVSGAAHVIMLNSRQVYVAISEDPDDVIRPALYVAIVSVGSAIGRLSVSYFEWFTQSKPADTRIPFTIVYCVPACLQMIACILFLTVPTEALLVPMLCSGIGIGVYAAAAILTSQTIFSLDASKHYNSIFFGDILAVIALNRFLFGELMTRNSTLDVNGAPVCLGRDKCIKTTFIVLTSLCALGFLASVLMHILYSRYAASIHRKRAEKMQALQFNPDQSKERSGQE